MDGHLIPNDVGQLTSGNLSSSKQRSRATTRDVSSADNLAILDCSAKLADATGIRRVEDGFDDGTIAAMPDQSSVSLVAEQQTNTGDHHGLSGAGLAGDCRQRGRGFEDRLIDDAESTNSHTTYHEVSSR
jgi:hypothetical protein